MLISIYVIINVHLSSCTVPRLFMCYLWRHQCAIKVILHKPTPMIADLPHNFSLINFNLQSTDRDSLHRSHKESLGTEHKLCCTLISP